MIHHIVVTVEPHNPVEMPAENVGAIEFEAERKLDRRLAITEDKDFRIVVLPVVEVPDDGADEGGSVFGGMIGVPYTALYSS